MRMVALVGAVILAAAAWPANGQTVKATAAAAASSDKWNALVDEYFEQVFFKFSPTAGTSAGLHQYDALLEDYSRAGIAVEVASLHAQ